MKNKKILFIRSLMTLTGLLGIGFGVAILRLSEFGIDSFGMMNIGISDTIGISFGTFLLLVNIVLVAFIAWKKREMVGGGTILAVVGLGYAIDGFYFSVLGSFRHLELSLAIRSVLMLIGILIVAVAVAFYVNANFGVSPYDALGFVVEELTNKKIKFQWARIGLDMICIGIGLVFGGPFGLATLFLTFLIGPLIHFFKTKLAVVIKGILNEQATFLPE